MWNLHFGEKLQCKKIEGHLNLMNQMITISQKNATHIIRFLNESFHFDKNSFRPSQKISQHTQNP